MSIYDILEILENYKLRIPPTVYYELKADIVNFEETPKKDLAVEDCIKRSDVLDKIQRLIAAEVNNIDKNGDYMNYARERVNAYEAIQFFVENEVLCPSYNGLKKLEDIKAEIQTTIDNNDDIAWCNGLMTALEIIDRHISGKEQE